MPDTDSIVIVQKFTYRGKREEFSNRYHLDGTTPSDVAGWKTVADDLWAKLALLYDGQITMVRSYGYVAGNDHAIASHDYESGGVPGPGGTMSFTGQRAPGDAAMTCRWWTGAYNTRGKKIYLRKYFHGCYIGSGEVDKLDAAQLVKLQAFADSLKTTPISGDLKLVGPQGAAPVDALADPFITTRTLKRRGRRPPG